MGKEEEGRGGGGWSCGIGDGKKGEEEWRRGGEFYMRAEDGIREAP